MKIDLKTASRRLFVGSYQTVHVGLDGGVTLEDLDLVLDDPVGGIVSRARPEGFDPKHPTVTLLAGHRLGRYVLRAVDRATGDVVGELPFTLTDRWARRRVTGPSFWFSTEQDISHPLGGAWGGGPNGPQNTRAAPLSGTWRIAVVLADTSSARYPTDATTVTALRDRWQDEVADGVVVGGETRSVRHYVEEVSYGNLTVSAQTYGPYQLTGAWTDYFNDDSSFRGTLVDAVIAAADDDIDFSQVDSVLIVTPPVPATATEPARSAWPFASIGRWGPYTTDDGARSLGIISMPSDWGVGSNREIYETASHELAHNLGLWDQYTPGVAGRNVGSWDVMHDDDSHPHLTVAQRMMLGWVRPEWVRPFDFSTSPAPLDTTVQLHPLNDGAPPAGRHSGIEVRIADGLNYYFEYRREQAGHIGDENLPEDSRVLGTDVMGDTGPAPIPRPQVLLLPDHPDDDGAVLGNGESYRDWDYTTPGFPQQLRVDASGIDGSKADVRVRYGANGRPDPSIRPWPAGPDRPWQSPDLEVRNARSSTRAEWVNVPWAGHANTVVARVRNGGTVAAPDVVVSFYVKNYSVSGAPETYLGSDTRTIAPGATEEFTSTWVAPASGHFCLIARIPLYQVPSSPSIVELTELNNMAQSNYDRFIPTTASPSTRERTLVEVENPYDEPTTVFINAGQTNPTYRVLVEHRWLRLRPRQRRRVAVEFEWAVERGADVLPPDLRHLEPRYVERLGHVPNRVGLSAWALVPGEKRPHALGLLGGAMAEVQVGRRTHVEKLDAGDGRVVGRVVTDDDERGVPGGPVLVTLDPGKGDPLLYEYVELRVGEDGVFEGRVPQRWRRLWVDYLGDGELAPCTSEALESPKATR